MKPVTLLLASYYDDPSLCIFSFRSTCRLRNLCRVICSLIAFKLCTNNKCTFIVLFWTVALWGHASLYPPHRLHYLIFKQTVSWNWNRFMFMLLSDYWGQFFSTAIIKTVNCQTSNYIHNILVWSNTYVKDNVSLSRVANRLNYCQKEALYILYISWNLPGSLLFCWGWKKGAVQLWKSAGILQSCVGL